MNDPLSKPTSCLLSLRTSQLFQGKMTKHPSAHQHQKTQRENCLFPKKNQAGAKAPTEEASQGDHQAASRDGIYFGGFTESHQNCVFCSKLDPS